MRLRKVKNAEEIVNNNPDYVLTKASIYKGKWKEFFKNDNPLYIEIGMGKGQFIYSYALNNPNINFIGIEKEASVIIRAVEKLQKNPLSNLILINMDASNILEIFESNEVDKIFLNFSDPWPKSRHSKRRLTYPTFLLNYVKILNNEGDIEIKSDNRKLFEYTIITLNNLKMTFLEMNLNLHEGNDDNIITTEYEDRFIGLGKPIYYIKVKFRG